MRSIAILAILFFAKLLVAQNLIVNPGAEDISLTGWTTKNGLWMSSNDSLGEKKPNSGKFHFYAGDGNPYDSELYQNVDLSLYATEIDAGKAIFSFYGYLANYSFNNDAAQIILEYRDASDNILQSISLPNTPYTGVSWRYYPDLNRIPPIGTRKVRIRLLSIYKSNSASDGYFDDLSLTVTITAPVTLLFFNAITQDNQALLTWQTANETNNKYFVIEKSSDALHWDSIGHVAGRVNSHVTASYEFIDPVPLEKLQYYRLKQVDVDGHFTHFPIRAVHPEGSTQPFTAYTNNEDQLVVAGAQIQRLDVYNAQGQLIAQFVSQELEEQLTLSALPSGSYILKITTDSETYSLKHIVP